MEELKQIRQLARYYFEVFRYLNSKKISTIKNILKSNKKVNPFIDLANYWNNFDIRNLNKDKILEIALNDEDIKYKEFYQELRFIHEKAKQPSSEGAKQLFLCFPFLIFKTNEKEIYTPIYKLPINIKHNIDKNTIEIEALSDILELNFYGLKEIFDETLDEYYDSFSNEVSLDKFQEELLNQLKRIFNLRPDIPKESRNLFEDRDFPFINLEVLEKSLENLDNNRIYLKKNLVVWMLSKVDYHVEQILKNIFSNDKLNIEETAIEDIFKDNKEDPHDLNNYKDNQLTIYTVLPSNKEQLKVIQSAIKKKITVVEGPPGTGKSHTITNLALHLLQKNKKILITSYTTKALEVVADKIDKLNLNNKIVYISWLKGDKEGRKKLLHLLKNLRYLLNNTNDFNKKDLQRAIEEKNKLEKEFSDYINKEKFFGYFAEKLKDINDLSLLEKTFSFIEILKGNNELLDIENDPQKYYELLIKKAEIKFKETNFQINIKKFQDIFNYFYEIKQDGYFQKEYFQNDIEFIENLLKNIKIKNNLEIINLVKKEKEEILINFNNLKEIYNNLQNKNLVYKFFENISFLINSHKEVENLFNYYNELQNLLEKNKIPNQQLLDFQKALSWGERFGIEYNSIEQITKYENNLKDLLQGINSLQRLQSFSLVMKIIKLFKKNYLEKRYQVLLNFMFKNNLNSALEVNIEKENFFENKRNIKDLELKIKERIIYLKILERIHIFMKEINQLTDKYYEKASSENFTDLLVYNQNILQEKLFNFLESYEKLNEILDNFIKQIIFISALLNNFIINIGIKFKSLTLFYETFNIYGIFRKWENFNFFINKFFQLITDQYLYLFFEVQNKNRLISILENLYELIEISEVLNLYPGFFIDKILALEILNNSKVSSENINQIINQINQKSEQIRNLIKEHIDDKINGYLKEFERDRDLKINIGSLIRLLRLGKNNISSIEELKNRIDFDKVLNIFKLWIVNINDVFRIFPFKPKLFDYIIIDEASQLLPIYLLPLMIMSKHIVVVGDDKQLRSPELLFYKEDLNKIFVSNASLNLEDKVLFQFIINRESSCINVLSSICEEVITLREHYRCLPEIIRWSNKKFYENYLRIMTDNAEKIDKVFEFVYINNAMDDKKINKKEAEKVISDLILMLKNGAYKKFSFGVITPFREQAEYLQYLFIRAKEKDIDLEKICKEKEDDLKEPVIISTIDGFQGDERDVILYSFRYAPNSDPKIFAIERQELGRNRINVAFTRARKKMIFYLSVKLEELPEGLIKDFLKYAQNPDNELQKKREFDSEFEEDVYNRLKERGFNPIPQYQSCGFYIDLALFIDNKKIGIECDGWQHYDSSLNLNIDDIERQEILERAGWKIYRIPSTIYWKNPEGFLDEMINDIKEYISSENIFEGLKEKKIVKSEEIVEDKSKENFSMLETIELFDKTDIFSEAKTWFNLSKWAKENNRFTKRDRKFLYDIGKLIQRGYELTEKQKNYALRLLKIAINKGFDYEQKEN